MAAGSPNKLAIDGLPFDIAGDSDLSEVFSRFTNTIVPSSGEDSISQEARAREVSGVVIILKKGDKQLLANIADSGDIVSLSYTVRDGSRYAGRGNINIENNQTMQNRTSITLLPVGEWTETLS